MKTLICVLTICNWFSCVVSFVYMGWFAKNQTEEIACKRVMTMCLILSLVLLWWSRQYV